jgi:serine protease Do
LPPDNPFAEPGDDSSASPLHIPRRFESLASGVIVDANNGYILTNAHALRDVKTITITLGDGRVFKAKLIGIDPPSDIAVLQIKADKLTAAELGNSDVLKVGDFVAAIGNPFGLSQTVTSGIVSGLQRSGLGIEGYENFIQTDASINPGNSGGALTNLKGEVIGINTAIIAPAGGNVGIGFAIPINMARSVMAQLIKYGSVKRGLMGVYVQDLTPALANAFHVPDQLGGLVSQVAPASPAAAAGIQPGDIIQEVNGQTIQNGEQVRNIIGMLRVGSQINLKLLRDNKTVSLNITTADPEQYMQAYEQKNRYLHGLNLRDFHEQVPSLGFVTGVQVMGAAEDSAAWLAGVRPGDVILSANQTSITSIEQLQKIADEAKQGLLLNVMQRGGGASFLFVK